MILPAHMRPLDKMSDKELAEAETFWAAKVDEIETMAAELRKVEAALRKIKTVARLPKDMLEAVRFWRRQRKAEEDGRKWRTKPKLR